MSEWTNGPWNSHIREMTGADGETRRKCFIEKGGKALAQFANFGDENEANARLCAVAPEMYLLLQMLFDEIRRNIWSDQRRKLYMERILRVKTWAMNGREREQE